MKKVNARSRYTPLAEFLVFSMANMKPNAPARNRIVDKPAPIAFSTPVLTPTHAPSTVGTSDTASKP